MRRLRTLAFLAVLAFGAPQAAGVIAQSAPPPPPPPPPPQGVIRDPGSAASGVRRIPVGTAQIAGMVTAADTGRPVRGARVSLNGSVPAVEGGRGLQALTAVGMPGTVQGVTAVSRVALTDDQGQFAFDRLPAGRFTLSVSRAPFLGASYGQKRPGGAGTAVAVADGQRMDARISLVRGGVITGMVLDDNGEPQPGVQVRTSRFAIVNGIRRLQNTGAGSTDDRGIYRLSGLQPGEYVVAATPSASALGVADASLATALALEQTIRTAPIEPPAAPGAPATVQVTVPRNVQPPGPRQTPPGYLPTYYPSMMQALAAQTIRVNGGDEHAGIDIRLQAVQATHISGMVTSPPQTGVGIRVTISSADATDVDLATGGAMVDQDGRFLIRSLAPGSYVIHAQTIPGSRNVTVVYGVASPPPQVAPRLDSSQRLWGRAYVTVDGQEGPYATIAMQGGRSVSGTVLFDMARPPDLTRARVVVTLANAPGPQAATVSSPPEAQVGPDGRFTLEGVIPGRYILRTTAGPLKEAIVGGQDTLDFPLEFTAEHDLAGATLTVTDKTTELSGLLTDMREQPAVDYTVVVAAADPRFWIPGSRRISLARPDTSGRYAFRGLPPGDYLVAAVTDIEPGTQYDPEFLRSLAAASVRVSLGEGAKVESNLRLGR